MTTAATDGRPADPPGGAPPSDAFVVRPDRSQANRMIGVQGGLTGLLFLLMVARLALGSSDGAGELLWAIGPMALSLLGGVWVIVVWHRFRTADALAEISAWGIRVNDLGRRGWVGLPWDAVASVREDIWNRIVVKPAEGVGPSTPGTEWPDSPSTARRARRKGLLIFVQQSDVAQNQVLVAITHFSGGRLPTHR